MTEAEIQNRLDEWCEIDCELDKIIRNCNKRYWMFDKDHVLSIIKKRFSEIPAGTKTSLRLIVDDTLHLKEAKKTIYGRVYIYENYFIDEEDRWLIWGEIEEYAKSINRNMDIREAYGYPPDSHPKLGEPYFVNFIMKDKTTP